MKRLFILVIYGLRPKGDLCVVYDPGRREISFAHVYDRRGDA